MEKSEDPDEMPHNAATGTSHKLLEKKCRRVSLNYFILSIQKGNNTLISNDRVVTKTDSEKKRCGFMRSVLTLSTGTEFK